jgi:hypothetical protein
MKQVHSAARQRPRWLPARALYGKLVLGASLLFTGATACGAATLAIGGKPAASVTAGSEYVFTPTVTGAAAGHALKFTIANKPSWAGFNASSGELFGYPQSDGTTSGIVIAVSDGVGSAKLPAFSVGVTGTNPVKISGTPPATVTAGSAYSFRPTASDAAGHALSYTIVNKPAWANFSISTGQLSGTPSSAQTGSYPHIVIMASDGKSRAFLPMFAIAVSSGSASGGSGGSQTLAQKHPGDIGMGSDPAVVHYEDFSEPSVAAVVARYDSYKNPPGMALVADRPVNSPSPHALRLTAGGAAVATDLYKNFGAGYDELYFRYYVKYEAAGPWHHSGLWFGGYNPPLPYPYPHAGERPVGNDRYSIALEPIGNPENAMDFYVYWRGMHSWMAVPSGARAYYGNTFLHDPQFVTQRDTWVCLEVHLKLNPDPATASGAILEVWQNDALIRRFDDTGPLGYWVRDKFCPHDATGKECTIYRPANPDLVLLDQRWRTTSALKINYFWPQNYNTATTDSSLLLDDMVVAKQRVGCTVKK